LDKFKTLQSSKSSILFASPLPKGHGSPMKQRTHKPSNIRTNTDFTNPDYISTMPNSTTSNSASKPQLFIKFNSDSSASKDKKLDYSIYSSTNKVLSKK